MKFWKQILPILICANAIAQPLPVKADTLKPTLIFFGGFGSTAPEMSQWKNSTQRTTAGAAYDIRSYFLGSASPDAASSISSSRAAILKIVAEINSAPAGRSFVLAGHSSGSAVTNKIAKLVQDKSKIKLLVLDGFLPRNTGLQSEQIECWSAVSSQNHNLHSRNAATMRSCPGRYRETARPNCSTPMCLHYAVVTKNPNSGYHNMDPNLDWLTGSFQQNARADGGQRQGPGSAPSAKTGTP